MQRIFLDVKSNGKMEPYVSVQYFLDFLTTVFFTTMLGNLKVEQGGLDKRVGFKFKN